MPRTPLARRRIWFVGIGGAGLSAYALLARAWGAEIGGWDRVRTPYLRPFERERVEIAEEPVVPEGWEVVVSTAYAGLVDGRSRADFLAELVALQDAIVVGGSHGKGTTAALIAYALDRLGRDPGFLVGAEVPQLGGNARAGEGWLVVEGDESDRTVFALRPEIAVVTNVDLDHHTTFASRAELASLFEGWLAAAPHAVRGEVLDPYDGPLTLPGAHNRRNAACALAALQAAGVDRAAAAAALADFAGTARRLQLAGEAGGVSVYDDYGHHPAELAATFDALREHAPGRLHVLFQPHLYSRTRHLAHEFGQALARADTAAVTEVYRARERPLDGVTGKLLVEAAAEARPGMAVAWTPRLEDGARLVARRARPGDVVLTIGAGDVDRAVPVILEALG